MEIRKMNKTDISSVVPIYLDYYNNCEDGCWTAEKAQRRIRQVVCMEDSYSLILCDEGNVIGFAMEYFKQYDDIIGYTLEEILIASPYQNRGIGSWFLNELEHKASERGASLMELLAVNDDLHEHYYGKANYYKATNFVPRAKWLK